VQSTSSENRRADGARDEDTKIYLRRVTEWVGWYRGDEDTYSPTVHTHRYIYKSWRESRNRARRARKNCASRRDVSSSTVQKYIYTYNTRTRLCIETLTRAKNGGQ